MAVDEFLFRRVGTSPSTYLRFYQWDRPTASLGYSQAAAKVVDVDFCRRHGVGIVRRITGGKLVLHDREVTYTVASSDAEVFTETLRSSYQLISRALMRGLELMGLKPCLSGTSPPDYIKGVMPCFALPARDEIEIGGKKIVGSAQKRTGAAFLQHGSIPLDKDDALLASVASPGAQAAPKAGMSGMTSLSEALDRPADFDWAVERFSRGFSEFFGASFKPLILSPEDLEEVAALRDGRYATDAWTFRS
jgi:lipoate-protein ligase A